MLKIPIIAVTAGDPAGIGAEIAVKAFSNKYSYNAKPVIICDASVFFCSR